VLRGWPPPSGRRRRRRREPTGLGGDRYAFRAAEAPDTLLVHAAHVHACDVVRRVRRGRRVSGRRRHMAARRVVPGGQVFAAHAQRQAQKDGLVFVYANKNRF